MSKKQQHKTDSNGVQSPPGDIFANNYGRGHMKPSHQVSYDMRLPPNKKIPVKNDQYIQGTPWRSPTSEAEILMPI